MYYNAYKSNVMAVHLSPGGDKEARWCHNEGGWGLQTEKEERKWIWKVGNVEGEERSRWDSESREQVVRGTQYLTCM